MQCRAPPVSRTEYSPSLREKSRDTTLSVVVISSLSGAFAPLPSLLSIYVRMDQQECEGLGQRRTTRGPVPLSADPCSHLSFAYPCQSDLEARLGLCPRAANPGPTTALSRLLSQASAPELAIDPMGHWPVPTPDCEANRHNPPPALIHRQT